MGIKDVFPQRDSIVIFTIKDDGKRDYGNTVYLQDDLGNRFCYCHLDWFANMKAGDKIPAEEVFAEIGETGYCPSGPHLHYGMFKPGNGYMGALTAIDPTEYIQKYGYPCKTAITNEYGSKYCNPKLPGHEGIDFSSWRQK